MELVSPHTLAARRPAASVPAATIMALLRESCERWPQSPVLIFDDGLTLTRAELRDLVERAAGLLQPLVGAGDRVALVCDNRAEYLVAFLAVVLNRAAVVPVNPVSGPSDALHILRSSGVTLAITDGASASLIEGIRDEVPSLRHVLVLAGEEPEALSAPGQRRPLQDYAGAADDILAVTFTSGTTGLPKGCMVDHAFVLHATDVAVRVHPYEPGDRIFYPVKFFYLDALLALLRALHCGGAYVAARRFSVSRFWDTVRVRGVTIISTIASMPVWLLKEPAGPRDRDHAVRYAIQAQIPRDLHAEMDARWGFPWLENYGMMEAGIIARVPLELADELRGSGSAGPPAPGVTIRVADEQGRDVPTGSAGEILVSAPAMFRGYLGQPDATAELLRGGWLHTGDLGVLDARGYVSIVGRKKDVIRRSGENVSAVEVETTLRSHPLVLDAAVLGVPDRERGEELKAFVQLVDRAEGGTLPPGELVAFCAGRLAPHKVPRYVEYVADFPRTPSLRVRKEVLRTYQGAERRTWDREAHRDPAPAREERS